MCVHVAPCQVAIFMRQMREGGGGHFKDISEGRCCLNICMMYSVVVADMWVGGGLQKYCDILCNYICGIALCWQSQSEVLKCISRTALLENILLQLCLY